MRFQSFDTAWGVKKVEEKPIETTGIEQKKEEVFHEPIPVPIKKPRLDLKREEFIIIGLAFTCFFLFLWAISATMSSNRITRLHSQLLDKLILNLAKN